MEKFRIAVSLILIARIFEANRRFAENDVRGEKYRKFKNKAIPSKQF